MSKKKSFSGNTMTLKDFHGGSIPSDISLPSAPGLIMRPTDRQNSWGNSGGQTDHQRLRPRSSGSMRSLDDNKTLLFSNTFNIGRNFDEDERNPLNGGLFAPRRTVSDESFGGSVVVPPQSGGSYSGRVVVGGQPGVSGGVNMSENVSSRSNVWGVKKETCTISKFAQASALDQISSGRWQTKPMQQVEVEVIKPLDTSSSFYGRDLEKVIAIEDSTTGGYKEMPCVERVHSSLQSSVIFSNEGQAVNIPDGKYGDSELQRPLEVTERAKLKLLPRSKPLDVQVVPSVDHKPGFQRSIDTSYSSADDSHGNASQVKPSQGLQLSADTNCLEAGVFHGNGNHVKPRPSSSEARQRKPETSVTEAVNRVFERPKLNLKPRTQQVDNLDGRTEEERRALFGGARPREMVLKERGVDGVVTSHNEAQSPSRINDDSPHGQPASAHPKTSRQSQRVNNLSVDHQRTEKVHEKNHQKSDIQKKNRRNDNWRTGQDTQKKPQQERQPSPETWRKPVDQSNTDKSGLRFGKVVSAVDLVEAFSRSVSGPKPVDQFPGQKGFPIRSQMPFSRLTGPTTRPQINGY